MPSSKRSSRSAGRWRRRLGSRCCFAGRAIILLTEVLPPLWEKLTWVWDNWNSEDILVSAQETLRDDVLPAIIGTVSGVAGAIADAASWLAETVSAFGDAMGGVLDVFGANSCLTAVTNYLNHVADQYQRLAAWAEDGFAGLSDALQAVFDALTAIFQPILDFLVRLLIVALNPPMLPIAIAGAIWLLCPDGLKPPVIDFVLGLLIAFIDGSTLFLAPLGPMAFVLQAGTLGFLRELRGGGDIDEKHRIAASNKIANLAAGGGPAFILGFSLGFLHGVIDGVIDPFRLIFLIGRVLVAGAQAISRALEPFILATLPGAAETVAGIRGLPMAPATGPPEAAAAGPAPASPVGAGARKSSPRRQTPVSPPKVQAPRSPCSRRCPVTQPTQRSLPRSAPAPPPRSRWRPPNPRSTTRRSRPRCAARWKRRARPSAASRVCSATPGSGSCAAPRGSAAPPLDNSCGVPHTAPAK